ncbi:hypothetical protein PR048_003991 [Dryococelus australis]|uniref:Uncharacterized protein n=1 Tax=Dryococelus australis TaxID=614101 RepID=A0ABQ9I470_9NEOP|nr:hypothetical protein PR048_003991 [Dryococelus australis]
MTPLVCWVSSGISRFPVLASGAAPLSPHFTLIGSQDLVVKCRPNISSHLPLLSLLNVCIVVSLMAAAGRWRQAYFWAALNTEVLRADEGEARCVWSSAGMKGREKRDIPEKTRIPAASSRHDSHMRKFGSDTAGNRARTQSRQDKKHLSLVQQVALTEMERQDAMPLLLSPNLDIPSCRTDGGNQRPAVRKRRVYPDEAHLQRQPLVGASPARLDCSPPTKVNRVTPGFSQIGIVPKDTAGWRIFSGISDLHHSCIPALLHTHIASPSSALNKTSLLRGAQTCILHSIVGLCRLATELTTQLGTEVQFSVCFNLEHRLTWDSAMTSESHMHQSARPCPKRQVGLAQLQTGVHPPTKQQRDAMYHFTLATENVQALCEVGNEGEKIVPGFDVELTVLKGCSSVSVNRLTEECEVEGLRAMAVGSRACIQSQLVPLDVAHSQRADSHRAATDTEYTVYTEVELLPEPRKCGCTRDVSMEQRRNERAQRKRADQQHRPAWFPHAITRDRPRRESNPVLQWREVNAPTVGPPRLLWGDNNDRVTSLVYEETAVENEEDFLARSELSSTMSQRLQRYLTYCYGWHARTSNLGDAIFKCCRRVHRNLKYRAVPVVLAVDKRVAGVVAPEDDRRRVALDETHQVGQVSQRLSHPGTRCPHLGAAHYLHGGQQVCRPPYPVVCHTLFATPATFRTIPARQGQLCRGKAVQCKEDPATRCHTLVLMSPRLALSCTSGVDVSEADITRYQQQYLVLVQALVYEPVYQPLHEPPWKVHITRYQQQYLVLVQALVHEPVYQPLHEPPWKRLALSGACGVDVSEADITRYQQQYLVLVQALVYEPVYQPLREPPWKVHITRYQQQYLVLVQALVYEPRLALSGACGVDVSEADITRYQQQYLVLVQALVYEPVYQPLREPPWKVHITRYQQQYLVLVQALVHEPRLALSGACGVDVSEADITRYQQQYLVLVQALVHEPVYQPLHEPPWKVHITRYQQQYLVLVQALVYEPVYQPLREPPWKVHITRYQQHYLVLVQALVHEPVYQPLREPPWKVHITRYQQQYLVLVQALVYEPRLALSGACGVDVSEADITRYQQQYLVLVQALVYEPVYQPLREPPWKVHITRYQQQYLVLVQALVHEPVYQPLHEPPWKDHITRQQFVY